MKARQVETEFDYENWQLILKIPVRKGSEAITVQRYFYDAVDILIRQTDPGLMCMECIRRLMMHAYQKWSADEPELAPPPALSQRDKEG
jgi:hypothetical protein